MNNTNKLSNNNTLQTSTIYPQILFSYERKDYTIDELLKIFSSDSLDLIFLHNVIPPELPFATVRVSVPTLNLLIIVVPTATNYKIYYCDCSPTPVSRLSSKLPPLTNFPTLTQVPLPYQNHLVAHTVKQPENPLLKSHRLIYLIKKPQAQETEEHPYSVITTTKSTDRPRPTGHSPHLPQNQ